jgi:hypothetical protein
MLSKDNKSIYSKIIQFFFTCYYHMCDTNKREAEENPYVKLKSSNLSSPNKNHN